MREMRETREKERDERDTRETRENRGTNDVQATSAFLAGGVSSGASGALLLTFSGTALNGVLLSIVFGPSTFVLLFGHTPTCHRRCASQRRKGCATHKN